MSSMPEIQANRGMTVRIVEKGEKISVEVQGGFISVTADADYLVLEKDDGDTVFCLLELARDLMTEYQTSKGSRIPT